jgi:hypothetical protein
MGKNEMHLKWGRPDRKFGSGRDDRLLTGNPKAISDLDIGDFPTNKLA